MKLGKLVDPQFQNTLRKLAAQEMPLKTAFKLKGMISRINTELLKYDEVRTEALKRLGNKKEDDSLELDENGSVKLSDENLAKFANEMDALISCDVEVGYISVAELGDDIVLSTTDLLLLDPLVTE